MKQEPAGVMETEDTYRAQVLRDLPGNTRAILAHGMLGLTGFRLVTAPTFVPAYIYLLSGSKMTVGILLSVQYAGMAFSSIWGATLIEHRQRVMPLMVIVGWLVRAQILGLALSSYLLAGNRALIASGIFLLLFGFFNGIQNVAFTYLISKIIPVEFRGRLTGLRNFLGGLTAAAVAYLGGKYLVGGNMFGNGYAITFFSAFILTSLGITALTFMREPNLLDVRRRSNFHQRVRELPALLRKDAHYVRFFIARALGALGMMAVPFYAIYAGGFIELSGTTLGYLTIAYLLAQTTSNLAWGHIADRHGYRLVFLISVTLWAVSTFGLILSDSLSCFLLVFGGLGAGFGGYFIASENFALEFGERHDRPMLLAISNTAAYLMMALGPLVGGMLAQLVHFPTVFLFAIFVKTIAVLMVLRLREPRRQVPRADQRSS